MRLTPESLQQNTQQTNQGLPLYAGNLCLVVLAPPAEAAAAAAAAAAVMDQVVVVAQAAAVVPEAPQRHRPRPAVGQAGRVAAATAAHEGGVGDDDGSLGLGGGHLIEVPLHEERLPAAHKPVLLSGMERRKRG